MSYALDGVNHNLRKLTDAVTAVPAKSAIIAVEKLAGAVARLADAAEGIERRTARLEESVDRQEASSRRLAEALERLSKDGN